MALASSRFEVSLGIAAWRLSHGAQVEIDHRGARCDAIGLLQSRRNWYRKGGRHYGGDHGGEFGRYKAASATIPIVTRGLATDPVASGLVDSMRDPGSK